MKVSVSLSRSDVEFLDSFAKREGVPSRSAAVSQAIASLKSGELGEQYATAWDEWEESGEADAWSNTTADGLDNG